MVSIGHCTTGSWTPPDTNTSIDSAQEGSWVIEAFLSGTCPLPPRQHVTFPLVKAPWTKGDIKLALDQETSLKLWKWN